MPRRGDICNAFDYQMFRFYFRKKFSDPKEFAKVSGFNFSLVYKWLGGTVKPTWRSLVRIAETLDINPRLLLQKNRRVAYDKLMDHLLDWVHAPPETITENKEEIREGSSETGYDSVSVKTKQRELKLTERAALELAEKMGILDIGKETDSEDTKGQSLEDFMNDNYTDPEQETD